MHILKNPLRQYKTDTEKRNAYNRDCARGAVAYTSAGDIRPLNQYPISKVEFIGGLWRVQNETNYKISKIRDKQLILGERLEYNERTYFEYYQAMAPYFNCYGLINGKFDMVVAKYDTDSGPQYGYGRTIPDARAFLGIRLYDQHMDLIHSVTHKHTL